MTPNEQFLNWLEKNDPFVYAVVIEKLRRAGTFAAVGGGGLNGLGFGWSDITSVFSSSTSTAEPVMGPPKSLMNEPSMWTQFGSAVVDAAKTLPSVLMDYKASQDIADAQKRAARQPAPPPAPAPNVTSTDEILRRLAIAQSGGNQPGGAYAPMVDPNKVRNFSGTVKASAKTPTKWEYAVALKLASMPPAERNALIRKNAAKKAAAKSNYMAYLPVGLGFLLLFGKKIFK